MNYRAALLDDCALLAQLNHQLIQDEGHRNPMTIPELEQRMRSWLSTVYTAILFELDGKVVSYAIYREQPDEVYLRQFFVVRGCRRQGLGREAMRILFDELWPRNRRLTVEVLTDNKAGMAFWRAVGYRDYSLLLEVLPGAPRPGT